MSGAQWSPERLDGVASVLYERGFETAAHAVRDFARVVSVLGDKRLRVAAISPFGWIARIGNVKGTGSDPLVAILALGDALADALAGEQT